MKICGKCKFNKCDDDFAPSQFKKKSGWCFLCVQEYRKIYYQENKDIIKKLTRSYKVNNNNKIKESSKLYYEKNKKTIQLKQAKYQKDRKIKDPAFKLRLILSNSIWYFLKKHDLSKNNSSILKYLPYTMQELKAHIESQFESWMNWDNWGQYKINTWNDSDPSTWTWQIDHIIPHCDFKYTSMQDISFKDCWALSNLRPYSAKQNILDNNRIYSL